jgi:hypothetical protein
MVLHMGSLAGSSTFEFGAGNECYSTTRGLGSTELVYCCRVIKDSRRVIDLGSVSYG